MDGFIKKEYIASKIRSYKAINGEFFAKIVEEFTEANVAEVVRCKDCMYCYKEGTGAIAYYSCIAPRGGLGKLLVPEKDFCSCGAWRTNNG